MSAPNDAVWYVMRDGQRFGPINAEAFARFEDEGQFHPTDGIWQPGADTWIAYSDYETRKTAARFVVPQRPGSSTKADRKKCTICRWVQSSLRALGRASTTAFRGVSTHRATTHAGSGAAPAADASLAPADPTPERALGRAASPSADPNAAAIPPSPLRSYESDLPPLSNGPVLEQPTDGVTRHHSNEDQDASRPAVTTEDVVGPLQYAPSIPRLANEGLAASHIGLELATFRAWVADGRLPHALPDCDKYDLKAIHLALDRMSGIASRANGSNDWLERLAKSQT